MNQPSLYIISDGKPGHLAQTRGLAHALARHADCQIVELGLHDPRSMYGPGLILVAGRKTYRPALRAKKASALPAIALMNPGWLLRSKFDLCAIPRHDGVGESANVLVTEGALNDIRPATDASPQQALLLIGGPSKHHRWEDASIRAQLHTLLARETELRWTATSSRRTPEATDRMLRQLAAEYGERFVYTPASQTPRGWVADQLSRCGVCWVSEDSVSMVYEALTAGARVGLLDVPRKSVKPGRVVAGVLSLIDRGWVARFDDWREGQVLPADRPALAEADRVAQVVLKRWGALWD